MPRLNTIRRLSDGSEIATAQFPQIGTDAVTSFKNRWQWIVETVADEFDCRRDDVTDRELTDAIGDPVGEVFCADGEPVAYLDDGFGFADFVALNAAAFPSPQMLEAAE